ncbi:hypothetical protein V8E54_001613 [Elaphomyces granulatus]
MGLDQEVQSTGASGAYGTFACANVNNTSEDEAAIMKVFMQICINTSRKRKARVQSEELEYYAKLELEGYKQPREGGCKSMSALLDYEIEKQGNGWIGPRRISCVSAPRAGAR